MKKNKNIKNQKKLINKISILSLHLGYGGIERSIVNQANMLCKNFVVEIVVLYKLRDEGQYILNDKVKVTYLSNIEPNKKAFLEALKNKKFLKIIMEGIKAVYIIIKKKLLIIKYMCKSNSNVIISTRLEFTKLLNRFGNKNCIKIAEEHVYHCNNNRYIKKLKSALKNIDYLLPASKYLTQDYQSFFQNLKTEIVYIPQTISYFPEKANVLSNKNILYVGRLEKEKGIQDLMKTFKIINSIDNTITLTIVGDGTEKDYIKEYIVSNNLENSIYLKGFLNGEFLRAEYEKASLFLLTSYEESFGLVVLEAMSFGIPVFSFSDAKGAKEIITEKNGLIISNRNHEKLAEAVISYFLLENKAGYQKLARKTSEKYYVDEVEKIWKKFINNINDKII